MFYYSQSTGRFLQEFNYLCTGYSGIGLGLNNPDMQYIPHVGPCPQGLWYIGPPFDSPDHGPFCMRLTPDSLTDTYGRDGFLLHGDSIENAGKHLASEGCIILPRFIRNLVATSGDIRLTVTV